MSSISSREKSSEVKVKFVDFSDFPETGQGSVTGFFKDIGALNAAFSKRFSQFISLHPSTPLGEMMEEYIRYQQQLEDKYGVKLHARVIRSHRDSPVTQGSNQVTGLQSSTPPATIEAFPPRSDFSKFGGRNTDSPRSTASEDVRESPKKRKADNFVEAGNRAPVFGAAARADVAERLEKPPEMVSSRSSGGATVPSGFFNLTKTKKAGEDVEGTGEKQHGEDQAKKSLFSGFGSAPFGTASDPATQGSAAAKPLNFGSLFGNSSGSSSFGTFTADKPTKAGGSFPSFFAGGGADSSAPKTTDTSSSLPPASTSFFSTFGAPAAPVTLGGFSFAGMAKLPAVKSADADEKDGDDGEGGEADIIPVVPPEDQDVAESDAVVSRKCVVYYMDNGAFTKRGVGMAHVKLLDGSSDAVQLLIRASTSLGAILLNTRISRAMKPSRASQPGAGGKSQESVGFVSQATPPFKGADPAKLYSWTLKFKDAKDADEFYAGIEANIKK